MKVRMDRTMLRDHCIFYWWKRGTTLLVTYLHFFSLFEFDIGEERKNSKKHDGSS